MRRTTYKNNGWKLRARKIRTLESMDWKKYPLSPYYLVSPKGRVFSILKNKILKPSAAGNSGYLCQKVIINGKTVNKGIHRMVAETFLDNPEGLPDVDHIDHDKYNNNVENLRWICHDDNCKRAQRGGANRAQTAVISRNGREEMYHRSLTEAYRWLRKKGLTNNKSAGGHIAKVAKHGGTAYGYYWTFADGERGSQSEQIQDERIVLEDGDFVLKSEGKTYYGIFVALKTGIPEPIIYMFIRKGLIKSKGVYVSWFSKSRFIDESEIEHLIELWLF